MPEKCYGQAELDFDNCFSSSERRARLAGQLCCSACFSALHQRANQDELTGIGNRYALAKDFKRLAMEDNLLGAIHVDLERFGNVNTTRGHDIGDDMLRIAADSIREEDFTARLGGDEFLVLVTKRCDPSKQITPGRRALRSLKPEQRLDVISQRFAAIFLGNPDVRAYNNTETPENKLQMRIGTAVYEQGMSLKVLQKNADSKGMIIEPNGLLEVISNLITKLKP